MVTKRRPPTWSIASVLPPELGQGRVFDIREQLGDGSGGQGIADRTGIIKEAAWGVAPELPGGPDPILRQLDVGGLLAQDRAEERGPSAWCHVDRVVSAPADDEPAPGTALVGQIVEVLGQSGVEREGGGEVGKRIPMMGVTPRLRHHDIGSERAHCWDDYTFHREKDGVVARHGRQGYVDRGACPFAGAHLVHAPGPRE